MPSRQKNCYNIWQQNQQGKVKKRKAIRKIPLSQEIQKVYHFLIGITFILNLTLGTALLYFGNHQTTIGYELKELQLKHEKLLEQGKLLETQIIKAKTMESVLDREKNMEDRFTYIQAENIVVQK